MSLFGAVFGLLRGIAGEPTQRVSLSCGGTMVNEFVAVDITRDMEAMTASFSLTARSGPGVMASLPYASMGDGPIRIGSKVSIAVDGELDFLGWVESIQPSAGTGTITVSGRDVACDLVDCPSDPEGKHEYLKMKLDAFAKKVVAPFGLGVKVETDVGEQFDRMVIDAGETALSAIEKYARQRKVMVMSNGIGSILLTNAGKGPGAGAVTHPGNVLDGGMGGDWTQRYSDYYTKGQSEKNAGGRKETAPRDGNAASAAPGAAGPAPAEHPEAKGAQGYAKVSDGEVGRWRPTIALARTQAKEKDARAQAEWAMKTARGKSITGDYEIEDFRSGGGLWRPNGLIEVADSFSPAFGMYLVRAVTRSYSDAGARTRLTLTSPEAYAQ